MRRSAILPPQSRIWGENGWRRLTPAFVVAARRTAPASRRPTTAARPPCGTRRTITPIPRTGSACQGTKMPASANQDTTVVGAERNNDERRVSVPAEKPAGRLLLCLSDRVARSAASTATMHARPEEMGVVAQQFARFGAVCTTIRAALSPVHADRARRAHDGQAAGDAGAIPGSAITTCVDAWNYYLAHYNHGRGVVLIGHSQGSGVLTQLIKNEIDGKPIQKQLVSAILMRHAACRCRSARMSAATSSTSRCAIRRATPDASSPSPRSAPALPPPANTAVRQERGRRAWKRPASIPAALGGGSGPRRMPI